MLPTCFFLVGVLEDPSQVLATLASSESIREIDSDVVQDVREAAEISVALLSVHQLDQHPIWLWRTNPPL